MIKKSNRIVFYLLSFYLLIMFNVCGADDSMIKTKRAETSSSFAEMLKNFISNLLGSNTVTDTPPTDNSSDTEGLLISNASQSIPTTIGYSTTNNSEWQQQEVTSLDNSTPATTETTLSPEVLTSLGPSTRQMFSTTPPLPEDSRCYYDTHLKYYCSLPGGVPDVSFRDVYLLFFSDAVIEALLTTCPRGSWCLQNNTGYWDSLILQKADSAVSSLKAIDMCSQDLQQCIMNMVAKFVNCSTYLQMQFTTEALQLVCGLMENKNLTSSCYKQVISTLHVTLADSLRKEANMENEVNTCQSPEASMTQSLICAEVSCPKESKRFHRFTPWSWFISMEDDLMIECNINPAMCETYLQSNNSSNASDQGVNLDVQQQTVTPQALSSTKKEVTSTTPIVTSFSTTASWMQDSSTYRTEDDRCYTDAVFQNFCPVPDDMTDVSFWDLYSVFFSDSVVDVLLVDCPKGTWCLQNKYDYWDSLIAERSDMVMNSEISASMCSPTFQPCIDSVIHNFVNCSMYSQMVYVSEVMKLVCGLKRNPRLTSSCYKHVVTALHVTLADILRKEETETEPVDTCESPEAQMTKGLICVENSCPGESETFHSFKPWMWFTSVVNDLIDICGYDPTKCRALLQPPPGMGALVAVSIAVMVTALTLTLVVCTCYKRHRRTAVVKEGYQRLLTDGDES